MEVTRLAVGSLTEVKLEAVELGARRLAAELEVVGYDVASGVSRQPRGLEEILAGAESRAEGALGTDKRAIFGFGLEAGVIEVGGRTIDIGAVWALGRSGICGIGFSPGVALPAAVAGRVGDGEELAEAVAGVYGTATLADRDCSTIITGSVLPGVEFYRVAVELALADYQQAFSLSTGWSS